MGPPPPPTMGGPPGPGNFPSFIIAPMALANLPKAKATNLSTKALKSFNWAKIPPAKMAETIWKGLDDEVIHKRLKGDTYAEFEELFAAKETKAANEISLSNENLAQVKDITFLDGKRSQNISNQKCNDRYYVEGNQTRS